jgi:hypothetical protein
MLPATTHRGPSKKLRGKRRRLSAIYRDAERFSLDVREDNWWDLWHHHLDRDGYGNTSLRLRKAYLAALLIMLVRAGQQLAAVGRRFQVFVSLDVDDAGQDAIYVHTPNPNGQHFPYVAEATVWGDAMLEAALSKLLPELDLRAGHKKWTDDDGPRHTIVIYSPRIGVPLES